MANYSNRFFKEARFYLKHPDYTTLLSFSVDGGLGMCLQTLAKSQNRERLGLRLQARVMFPIYFYGGSMYFGTGRIGIRGFGRHPHDAGRFHRRVDHRVLNGSVAQNAPSAFGGRGVVASRTGPRNAAKVLRTASPFWNRWHNSAQDTP